MVVSLKAGITMDQRLRVRNGYVRLRQLARYGTQTDVATFLGAKQRGL
jgi:hypothetical protein